MDKYRSGYFKKFKLKSNSANKALCTIVALMLKSYVINLYLVSQVQQMLQEKYPSGEGKIWKGNKTFHDYQF